MKNTAAIVLGSLIAVTAGAQNEPPVIPPPPAAGGSSNAPTRTVPTRRPSLSRSTNAVPTLAAPAVPSLPAPAAPAAPPSLSTPRPVVEAAPAAPGAPGAAVGSIAPAPFEGEPGDDEVPNNRYTSEGAPLAQVLDEYFKLVDRIPIYGGDGSPVRVDPNQKIPLKAPKPMTRKEAIVFLETTLGMNGVTLVPIGDRFVKVVPEAAVAGAGGEFSKVKSEDLPSSGAVIQQIVQLKYASLEEVVNVVAPFAKTPNSLIQIPSTQTLVIRDYTENVKRILEVIEKIDTINEMEIKPEIIPVKYALASDIANVLGTLTPSGAGTTVGQTSRTGGLGGTRSGGTFGSSGTGSRVGGTGSSSFGNRSGTAGGVNTLQNNATGLNRAGAGIAGANNLQGNLQRIIQRAAGSGDFEILGNVKIIADERTNSLLIFASNTDMVMVKAIIEKLDVVLAQVLIESIIMEISLKDNMSHGVSVYQPSKTTGNFTGGGGGNNGGVFGVLTNISSPPGGFGYTGAWGNDLEMAVRAVAGDSKIEVLSRPRVQTSHAVPANLRIGEQYPLVTGTQIDINGGSRNNYQQTFIGIDLEILPLINPDGLVVMDITQDIQERGANVQVDADLSVPVTTQRAATAKVAVRDREIVALGGFIRSDRSNSDSGVPFLKDIPGLGLLFRSSVKDANRTEMMVLIKPTVLKTPEAASMAAIEMKDEMPSLKASSDEIRAEERKAAREAELKTRKQLGIKD